MEGVNKSKNNGSNQNEPIEYLRRRSNYPLLINDKGTCLKVRTCLLEYVRNLPSLRYKLKMNGFHLENNMYKIISNPSTQ